MFRICRLNTMNLKRPASEVQESKDARPAEDVLTRLERELGFQVASPRSDVDLMTAAKFKVSESVTHHTL